MKILLHTCCGPCATESIERLKAEGYEVILFFPNSNIFPREEWEKRSENAKKISERHNLKLIIENYEHESWLQFASGLDNEPEGGRRCEKCFEFNLTKAAEKARELGIGNFTTTLTISRYKNSKKIFNIARNIAEKSGVNFVDIDFKKQGGYEKSIRLSQELGLYRQNYCGCEFSLKTSIASPRE